MKYKPEPVKEEEEVNGYDIVHPSGDVEHIEGCTEIMVTGWEVKIDDNEYYKFNNQDDAVIFCLLLEIRDLFKMRTSTNMTKKEIEELSEKISKKSGSSY